MSRTVIDSLAMAAMLALLATPMANERALAPAPPSPTVHSERYTELPPILLPESAAPTLPVERTRPGQGAELVFAFVVDTLGRIELSTVETLATPDSATARAARSNLSAIRYVPARLVLDVGRCVTFNGERGHCGGVTPAVRKIRARVVLRIAASIPS